MDNPFKLNPKSYNFFRRISYIFKPENRRQDLQELLNTYLSWLIWNDENHRGDMGNCRREDWYYSNCCKNHRDKHLEYLLFYKKFRQLWRQRGFNNSKMTFSVSLLKYMVLSEELKIDTAKIEKAWSMMTGEWESVTAFSCQDLPLLRSKNFSDLKKEAVERLHAADQEFGSATYEILAQAMDWATNLEEVRTILSNIYYPGQDDASWQEIVCQLKEKPASNESKAVGVVWDTFFI